MRHGSNPGCWTCRLRRKKCDKSLPICGNCKSLEITCHSDRRLPEWMDNGPRQREMTQQLKKEVKTSARRRRQKKLSQAIERELDEDTGVSQQDPDPCPTTPSTLGPFDIGISADSGTVLRQGSTPDERPCTRHIPDIDVAYSTNMHVGSATDKDVNQEDTAILNAGPSSPGLGNELELNLFMAYLDYVLPILFPFYRPTLLEGGRGWLLAISLKKKTIFHIVISQAAYFFSTVPLAPSLMHQTCTSVAWDQLQTQTEMAIKNVQHDLQQITHQATQGELSERVYLLASIVQLLTLSSVGSFRRNWQMHLDAACALFMQIFQYHGEAQSSSKVAGILDQLHDPSFLAGPPQISPWNSAQAAFRFSSAILLVNDIIASTSLEQAPRLHEFHAELLTKDANPKEEALNLADFVGCENWVLIAIGGIAALHAWKKDMKKRGTLSMLQLVQRGAQIDRGLQDGLAQLDKSEVAQSQNSDPKRSHRGLPLFGILNDPPDDSNSVTSIWAYAARAYLHVVLSGWQTANHEIRDSVAHTVDLFPQLISPAVLRTLAWPLCVAGCLASEEQEPLFRDFVRSLGDLQCLGTIPEALRIMETVWRQRGQIDVDSWDIAASLGALGADVLLV